MKTWYVLGDAYLGEDPSTRAAFDVLAPVGPHGHRVPVYESLNETTPEPERVWKLAETIANAVTLSIPVAVVKSFQDMKTANEVWAAWKRGDLSQGEVISGLARLPNNALLPIPTDLKAKIDELRTAINEGRDVVLNGPTNLA